FVPTATGAQAEPDIGALVTAEGAVLWDPADDVVLFDREADRPRPMASTTKIMTVLLALESRGVDEDLVVSEQAVEVGRTPGAADLGLQAGQRIAVRSVLAGLILRSGNDGAVAIAEHLAGSEDVFVQKMNVRAAELGLSGTDYLDSSGLASDEGHHASPMDLARLAAVAMSHPDFAEWAGADRMDVPDIGVLENRNELIGTYQGATGVKTGYTGIAGLCLVASATRGDRTLYAAVLHSENSFVDVAELLDYGFEAYERPEPLVAGQQAATYRWSGAEVPLYADQSLAQTVPIGTPVTWRVVLDPYAPRPVAVGARLGRAELLVDGQVVEHVVLRAATAVPAPPAGSRGEVAGSAIQDTIRAFTRLHPVDLQAA
ncbi:MAG: D-alanyl-D-alanine carboxypeptidase family protein, partial [Egibacteraceae bacterium]